MIADEDGMMIRSIGCGWLVAATVLLGMAKASAQHHQGVALPVSQTVSCGTAIDGVKADLAERGYFIEWKGAGRTIYPRVEIDGSYIQTYYYNYPAERTDTVTFFLAGDSTRLYQGLMSSPVLMATLGSRVMAACNQVGMVMFSHWWEGMVPVGYFPDGKVRAFQWMDMEFGNAPHQRMVQTEEGSRILYEWGYYYSP
jgi:hypothetical protein